MREQLNQHTAALGTAPVGPLLFRLALPTITAQVVSLLYSIVDRIYIGRIPLEGKLALTGMGVTFPVITLISAFAALIGMGGAALALSKSIQRMLEHIVDERAGRERIKPRHAARLGLEAVLHKERKPAGIERIHARSG